MKNSLLDINNYILLNKIENSSFNELFTVKDKITGEVLAAKISLSSYDESDPLNIKLINIISQIKQLSHAAILQYIGYSPVDFHNENKLVVFSQFMPNKSLDTLLNQSAPSSNWNETKKIINIYGIASAMSFLHSHNITHGYLYPKNILFDDHMFPKISDFQLLNLHYSKQTTIDTQTVIYVAPELCGKTDHSKAGDIYSFGMVIYEILTNERPFKNLTFLEILTKVASGNRPEIPAMNDSYKKLIEKCWSHNPDDRPSFDEIKNLLRTDKSFITELIDENDFENYINFIDEYQNEFERSKKCISFDDFILNKMNIFKYGSLECNQKKQNDLFGEINKNNDQIKPLQGEYKDLLEDPFLNEKQNEQIKNKDDNLSQSLSLNNTIFFEPPKQSMPDYFFEPISKNPAAQSNDISDPKYKTDPLQTPISQNHNAESNGPFESLNSNSKFEPIKLLYEDQNELIEMPKSPYSSIIMQTAHPQLHLNNSDQSSSFDDSDHSPKKIRRFIPISPLISLNKYSIFKEEQEVDTNLKQFLSLFPNKSSRKEAIIYLKESIKSGSTKAMNTYGELLYFGKEVEMNKNEATKYFKMAFDNGDLDGMYNYACALYNGEGVKADVEKSINYFRTLAFEHEHANGMNRYGFHLLFGNEVPMDKKKAVSLFKIAADKGCPDAMFNYGCVLTKGIIVPKNKTEAFRYFKMSADHGYITSFCNCGCFLCYGIGVPVDINKGIQYLKIAADNNIPIAMFFYALFLTKKLQNIIHNPQIEIPIVNECIRYYKMSADNGVVKGMIVYGNILADKSFLPYNLREAAYYYKMAADKGSDSEIMSYVKFLLSGQLDVVNKLEIVKYYKKAADKGNLLAMKEYAKVMRSGDGVQIDKEEAGKYFKMAAEKGDIESMNMYGLMSLNGEIQCDKKEAFAYLTDAANNGFDKAIYNLGMAIYNGHGTAANKSAAIELLKKAARKGVKEAAVSLKALGIKYETDCSIY